MPAIRPQAAPINNEGKNNPADMFKPTVQTVNKKYITEYKNNDVTENSSENISLK